MNNSNWIIRYTCIMLLALKEMGYSDIQISEMSGISATQIPYLRRGERSNMGVNTVFLIEKATEEALNERLENGRSKKH